MFSLDARQKSRTKRQAALPVPMLPYGSASSEHAALPDGCIMASTSTVVISVWRNFFPMCIVAVGTGANACDNTLSLLREILRLAV
jgi:hypothetical protein